jgi:hypothetical protein
MGRTLEAAAFTGPVGMGAPVTDGTAGTNNQSSQVQPN